MVLEPGRRLFADATVRLCSKLCPIRKRALFPFFSFERSGGMSVAARDIMDTRFFSLSPDMTVPEAVRFFEKASRDLGRRVFGMMVIDRASRLVGMVSMYDILVLMRPKHIHIWGEMNDIDVTGFIHENLQRVKLIRVGDLMSTDIVTIAPDTHLLIIVDIMLRKHVRRLPVLDRGKVVGIVHISNVFFYLMEQLIR